MQIASVCIGDTLVCVLQVHSLQSGDEIPVSYELFFRDLPTGATGSIVAESENDAMQLLAAWIVIDDVEDIGTGIFAKNVMRLYSALPGKFLP